MNILIISYCDKVRTNAHLNHVKYADHHGYDYIYDLAPTKNEHFYGKVEKIKKLLKYTDWVFWLDDDAYFSDFSIKLEDIVKTYGDDQDLLFCESPVIDGKRTKLSSGNFFLKNTLVVTRFLEACLQTDLKEVKAWWDEEKYGHFTNGDLDLMVYNIFMESQDPASLPEVAILPYPIFNSRPVHYPTEKPFIVHFTGNKKHKQVKEFAELHHLNADLTNGDFPEFYTHHRPSLELTHRKLYKFLKAVKLI